MSQISLPMNAAHQHAANAEDYLGNGLLIPAAEEHSKAAEAYLSAMERSHDESAKRTLRLLYNEHCKSAKDIQRRIDKLKEDGKDPSLPQKLVNPQLSATRSDSSNAHPGIPRSAPSPPPQRPMYDSHNMVDESFMLLAGQRSDPGDAFNQFWNIMQGMLDNLSQPVAFATVPLGNATSDANSTPGTKTPPSRKDSNLSDTDVEEPILSRFTRRIGMNREGRSPAVTPIVRTPKLDEDFDDGIFDDGDELSGSFFLIPTGKEMSPAALRKENATLKLEVETMQKRLEATERVLQLRKEQDLQLRDSIFQATREAQRVMGASMMAQRTPGGLDFSSLNTNVPIPGISSGREAQYARRVKELEDELRTLRAENEKNKAMIVKFRERWEKLKESAKRKKGAKAAADAAISSVREKIVEEPEAEEELDGAGLQ